MITCHSLSCLRTILGLEGYQSDFLIPLRPIMGQVSKLKAPLSPSREVAQPGGKVASHYRVFSDFLINPISLSVFGLTARVSSSCRLSLSETQETQIDNAIWSIHWHR